MEFPDDVMVEISVYLDLVSTVRLLSCSKQLWKIRKRTKIKNCDTLGPLAKERRWNWGLGAASFLNDKSFVEYFVQKGAKRWDLGLRGACSGGHRDLFQYFVQQGAILGDKFHYTIGHNDIENYLMEHGACDWQMALASAAATGNKNQIQLCIENGADDWNHALYGAAVSGKQDLVDFFISKGATDWNQGLAGASCAGNFELVTFFIEKGANDWNRAMIYAIPVYALSGVCGRPQAPQNNLIEFFIEMGASDWRYAIAEAVEYEHRKLAEFFVKKGGTWDQCIASARKRGYKELEDYFKRRKNEQIRLRKSTKGNWHVFGKWARAVTYKIKQTVKPHRF